MDELDRLFQSVVRTVRDSRPENLSKSLEVGELLDLVPYRLVRADLGVETNDDYAHVVTRLLSGERGYLFVDDLMQDDLKSELASPNPNLMAYRAYANTRVTLSQEHARRLIEQMGAATDPKPAATALQPANIEPTRTPARAPAAASAPAPLAPSAPPVARAPTPAAPREPATGPRPPRPVSSPRPLDPDSVAPHRPARPGCKYCGQALPEGREVRYCPACGQNLLVRRCAACSAELEPGWKFCVACGRAASP